MLVGQFSLFLLLFALFEFLLRLQSFQFCILTVHSTQKRKYRTEKNSEKPH